MAIPAPPASRDASSLRSAERIGLPLIDRFGLNHPHQPFWQYVITGWLVATLPMLGCALLVQIVLEMMAGGRHGLTITNVTPSRLGPVFDLINLTVLTPWLETAVLVAGLETLRRFSADPRRVVLASACAWAVVHAAVGHWLWGLLVLWGFIVYSAAYLVWRARSRWKGFAAAFLIHGLNNTPGALALYYDAR